MPLAALLREADLLLPLGITRPVRFRPLVNTGGTGNPRFVVRRCLCLRRQRRAASAAKLRLAFDQTVPHRDAFVENKALALPAAFFRRDFFEIFQNPALQMIDILNAKAFDERRRLLAAYAAGAEHSDFLAVQLSRYAMIQAGNSVNVLVSGSTAPANVPIFTS